MIKPIFIAGGLLGLMASMPSDNTPPFPPIESSFRLLWKTEIGLTTFRNNIVLQGDKLWIGSNGNGLMDRGFIEPSSGMYGLDRRTGKKVAHFANELFGDMDVAGLLPYNNRLYFGNDNEEFLCTNLNGSIVWRNPTSGDIEHEPVLLKSQRGQSIVYATESGEVKAVDPETGNARWSYYVPGFDGWRPGDNRAVLKVKAFFKNTWAFYDKPSVLDLNLDGTNDLVYRTYSGSLIALDGNSGRNLWNVSREDGMDMTIGVLGKGKNVELVGLRSFTDGNNIVHAECAFYDRRGKQVRSVPVGEQTYGNGLNALQISSEEILLNGLTRSYLVKSNGEIKEIDRAIAYVGPDWEGKVEERRRNDANAVFGDRIITLPDGKHLAVVLNQHDHANYEQGFIEILSLEEGVVVGRFSIAGGSEMPPVIRDVNLDGKLDILIGGYDGYLYCYQLPNF